MINRGRLPLAVQQEFENLITRLSGFLSQTFDVDGNLIVANPNLAVVPVGGLVPFAGATAPSGYLLCDGSQVSRATYQSLFLAIGTAYGAGDGSTTFNVPDMRQRFPLGKAATGTGATLGSTGGSIDHTHTESAHSHTVSITSSTDGSHGHGGATSTDGSHNHGGDTGGIDSITGFGAGPGTQTVPVDHNHSLSSDGLHGHTIDADGAHSHSVSGSTSSDGAGDTGSANPPYLSVNYLIYTGVAS